MKLKAPSGVGDPCVAGVAITPRDGVYEVEAAVAALLIECFGFVEIGAGEKAKAAPAPLPKLSLPAFRSRPASEKP
jgi:hypothetical protein